MKRYSEERKQALIRKMLPPHNIPVMQLVEEEGISDVTLYTWRKQARDQGIIVSKPKKSSSKRTAEDKLAIVIETASLNEAELSEYCRKHGLYPDEISQWKSDFVTGGNTRSKAETVSAEKRRIKELEKELRKKEKALAETAALLVLRKKANAIWGDGGED